MGKLAVVIESCISLKTFTSSFILFSFIILFLFAIRRRKYSQMIPCRQMRFIDVFGNLSDFNFNAKSYNGYPMTAILTNYCGAFFEMFKKEELYLLWLGYMPFVDLITPDIIEELLKSTKILEKTWIYRWLHPWLGTGLLTSHSRKWKTRRKLLTPAFHFDILKDFQPIIHEKSMKLVKKFLERTSEEFINITCPVTFCSLDVICETTLGIDIKAQENSNSEYVKAVERVDYSISERLLSFWSWFDFTYFLTRGKSIKKDIKLLHDFTMTVIRNKKEQLRMKDSESKKRMRKRKPLIEVLLEHHLQTNELTEEDIREEVDTFTFEGHDTTATAMIWTLYLIGLYKDVQTKVQKELDLIFGDDTEQPVTLDQLKDMKYLECVIKESMRLYPPVPFLGRQANTDLNLCGYPIPKGAGIIPLIFGLHRNENIYPNPEIFDPERFNSENSAKRHHFAYIPFSAGPRNCIGQRLAMMEIKTVLANIFRNLTLKSLDHRHIVLPCIELLLRPSCPVRIKFSARYVENVSEQNASSKCLENMQ